MQAGTKRRIIYIGIVVLTILLNVIAWVSPSFCDAYITYVFPLWINTYGRLTGLLPFSVGEWMIAAGLLLVAAAIVLGIAAIILWVAALHWKERISFSIRTRVWRLIKRFPVFFARVLAGVCLVMTLNSSILYHATPFALKYFGEEAGEYTLEECIRVYNHVAGECNRLSNEVARDEEGRIVFRDAQTDEILLGAGEEAYLAEEAIRCMQKLGERYPQLDGWYPAPKPMFFSDLMCQMYMCGYYFPFSLEANYNRVMYIINKPDSVCHELAHLRGFIYEDEANFIAYLACLESEDAVFRYSGYLSVLTYLANDLNRAAGDEEELFRRTAEETGLVELLPQVREDNLFVEQREWDRIHENSLWDTEKVDEVSDAFTDTVLKLNGVSDGMVSYSRVVELLLLYYREGAGNTREGSVSRLHQPDTHGSASKAFRFANV